MRRIGKGLVLISSLFVLTHCGNHNSSSSSGDALGSSISGLQSIPSVSGMVASSSSSSSSAAFLKKKGVLGAIDLQAVAGTPPTMLDLSGSATLIDSNFFGGLVAQINTAQTATSSQANTFWQGQGACWLGQSVAESLGRMLENGTSMCYMREIPKVTGAISLTSGSVADITNPFKQEAADTLSKIVISGERNAEDVFIRVYGSNTVTSDVYKIKLHFCSSGTVSGSETIEVNKATGVYTASGSHGGDSGRGTQAITAYLKKTAAGGIEFDASKERTATSAWSGDWGNFKGSLTISPDNVMRAKRYNSFSFSNGGSSVSGIDKNYSVASFTGSNIKTLRFTSGGSKGHSTWGNEAHGYSVGTEFQNTAYNNTITDSSQYTEANAITFSTDAFFTESLAVTAPTFSDSCTETPNVTFSLNMQSSAMQTVQATCEADRFNNYGMCNTSTIQSAQNIIFSSQSY